MYTRYTLVGSYETPKYTLAGGMVWLLHRQSDRCIGYRMNPSTSRNKPCVQDSQPYFNHTHRPNQESSRVSPYIIRGVGSIGLENNIGASNGS